MFVDTSALLALAIASDQAHPRARAVLEKLQAEKAILVTTSYVVVETYTVLGRYGTFAMGRYRRQCAPLLRVVWVDRSMHEHALDRLIRPDTQNLTLVDVVSLEVMRALRIDRLFAFDPDLLRDHAQSVA